MRRFVFQPRWILGHLLVVAAALTCIRLADWQLNRAYLTEALQNWGYAFQWPLFSVFFLIGWWRMLRLESIRLDELEAAEADETKAEARKRARQRPPLTAPILAPAPHPSTGTDAAPEATFEDQQHAAYNRMLAKLASQDAARDEAGRP